MLTAKHLPFYLKLIRFDKPIGTLLLLWPTLWALWIASDGMPKISTLIIFVLGVFIMRSAGCIINDIADKDFDPYVERTKNRPLAAKDITVKEAKILLLIFLGAALILALFLSFKTLLLSIPAVIIALTYPFAKRYHSFPQAHLGVAFSFGIPMAFMEITNHLPFEMYLLFIANLFWTLSYDTEYAMSDMEDDQSIAVKSSALFFHKILGEKDYYAVITLQALVVLFLFLTGIYLHLNLFWYIALIIVSALFYYHISLIKTHDRSSCFNAFLNNNWAGLAVFLGIILG